MTTCTRRPTKFATAQGLYLGLDVHKESIAVSILSDADELKQCSIPATRTAVLALIESLPEDCGKLAVYEAGPTGYSVLRWLEEAGCEAFMTPPSLVLSAPGSFAKTDRLDSLKLAKQLRAGMLREVHALTDEQYADRTLVRARATLVRDRAKFMVRIRSAVLFHGIEEPAELKNWSEARLRWLESGPTDRHGVNRTLAGFVTIIRELTREIRALESEIREVAESAAYTARFSLLLSIPGIGVVTAMTVLTEIPDLAARFPNAKGLASFLGLAPREHSSGQTTRRGGISRTGNQAVRTMLVQAAWRAKRQDPRLERIYQNIRARRGRQGAQVAIVAVARHLAVAIRAVLRDGTVYECGSEDHDNEVEGNDLKGNDASNS